MKVKLHILKVGVGIGMAGLLVGCTGLSADRYLAHKQDHMVNQGNPPAFVAGYVDGCSSGRRLAGDKKFVYRKNNSRFEKDALYARGWQEGQINCRNEAHAESMGIFSGQTTTLDASGNNVDVERRRRMEKESRTAEAEMHEIWEELKK